MQTAILLNRETKLFLLLVCLFCSIGCSNSDKENKQIVDPYHEYMISNFHNYQDIYNDINTTISQWVSDSLELTKSYFFSNTWELDSTIIINSDGSRLFTTANKPRSHLLDSDTDTIDEIGGSKINGKWYFYIIPIYHYIARELYQDSLYSPFTKAEISYVAHKNVFSDALVKNENGEYVPNEEFFKRKFFKLVPGYPGSDTYRFRDSIILHLYNAEWGKIDEKEIESIIKSRKLKVKPPEPPKEEKSWWSKIIFGDEPKLFETEAWKNRNKKSKK